MYFLAKEHNPSHIHAYYGDKNGVVSIKTGELIEGDLPKNALKLVKQWVVIHKDELRECGIPNYLRRSPHLMKKINYVSQS